MHTMTLCMGGMGNTGCSRQPFPGHKKVLFSTLSFWGGGAAQTARVAAKGGALVPQPPLAALGWAMGNGGQRVWLGGEFGLFSLNSA